jgi:hypothetical protein
MAAAAAHLWKRGATKSAEMAGEYTSALPLARQTRHCVSAALAMTSSTAPHRSDST